MSRIGLKTITVPADVEVSIASDNTVTVKGPKGTLVRAFSPFWFCSRTKEGLSCC